MEPRTTRAGAANMRGVGEIVGALLVALVSIITVVVAFNYYMHTTSQMQTRVVFRGISATLCGKVLSVSNVGEVPVQVSKVIGIVESSKPEFYTEYVSALIQPHKTETFTLSRVYDYVYIVSNGDTSAPIRNVCK